MLNQYLHQTLISFKIFQNIPAFGVGIGVDRLAMALTQTEHIRQITWFPYVKPVNQGTE